MKLVKLIGCFSLLLLIFGFYNNGNTPISSLGRVVPDFSLKNTDKSMVSLTDFKNAKGFIVIFTCNHCPFAKLYNQRLNDLNTKYKALGVPLVAINSMDATIYEDTPQAFIIWKVDNNWIIKYSGAIDDNGEHPELAHSFIANAVDELLNNKPISMPETASFGCKIFYKNQP